MKKMILKLGMLGVLFLFLVNTVSATMLYFNPLDQYYDIGDILHYDLYGDIDPEDAIMGFGFDLSFDGGDTFITGPGDTGSYLAFDGFTGNSDYFYYDPLFDDGDTISGWRAFPDPDLSGEEIMLGTFQFSSFAFGGVETITLGADSLGLFGSEGLIPGAEGSESFMPNIPSATANPVPEPGGLLLLGFGLLGFLGSKKKVSLPNLNGELYSRR